LSSVSVPDPLPRRDGPPSPPDPSPQEGEGGGTTGGRSQKSEPPLTPGPSPQEGEGGRMLPSICLERDLGGLAGALPVRGRLIRFGPGRIGCARVLHFVPRLQIIQFSKVRPGTRPNSLVLSVTSIKEWASACPARR